LKVACQPKLTDDWVSPPSREALRRAAFACLRERRLVGRPGIEPGTPWLKVRCSTT